MCPAASRNSLFPEQQPVFLRGRFVSLARLVVALCADEGDSGEGLRALVPVASFGDADLLAGAAPSVGAGAVRLFRGEEAETFAGHEMLADVGGGGGAVGVADDLTPRFFACFFNDAPALLVACGACRIAEVAV